MATTTLDPPDLHPPPSTLSFDVPPMLLELPGGTLNVHSIHWYFMSSPFFDASSNNTSLLNQLRNDPDGHAILMDRYLFEERLRTRFPRGVRYLVVQEPKAEGEPWVIQRQYVEDGRVEIQGIWYTQGTRIVAAPSLLHVVQLRMVGVLGLLGECFDMGKGMGGFEPGLGWTSLPSSLLGDQGKKNLDKAGSRIASPGLASAAPTTTTATTTTQSHPAASALTTDATTTPPFSDALFLSSLALTNEYYDEYMDENPLQGEPGSFVFANTHGAVVNTRNKLAAGSQTQTQTQSQSQPTSSSSHPQSQSQSQPQAGPVKSGLGTGPATATATGTPSASAQGPTAMQSSATSNAPSPPAAAAGTGVVAPRPAGSKEKRRKSRGAASPNTPVTPGSGSGAGGGGGGVGGVKQP